MAPLPQELVDAMVAMVPDEESLRACALTAASFADPSQRRIFRSMTIREERHTQTGAFKRIADILTHSPHLSHHVRSLSLVLKWVPDNWPPLESILSTTTRVERLAIQGINPLFTTELHSNSSLIEVLSLKTLRCIALTTVSMSPSIATMVLETFE
ncbi:hypothetical protein C8R45DRAFT_1091342 [Mycena sanguinolenta]|nr:hypothetical protein C8R45DRAFT_1091342 [Mycena sanguinolenta]